MTTIVAVNDRLVSDSRITMEKQNGDITKHESTKLYRKGNAIIGTSGDCSASEAFLKWYGTKKKKPKFDPKTDFEALVLTSEGIYHFDENCTGGKVNSEYMAIGSGSGPALGALYCGKSPEEACEIACKFDPLSGLPIQVLKLEVV